MKQKYIAYVEHPVTPEQKAELRGKGFKILDLRHKPETIGKGDKVVKKTRPKKVKEQAEETDA